jgi:predicted nuclease with TOPRIM domain
VGHVSVSSEEIKNLRIQLAQAIYDRNHSVTELRKAQEEIGGLKATVEGLDKLVSEHSGYERRYREMAGELEAAKAQVAATREENLKLLGKLEGLKRLLGS